MLRTTRNALRLIACAAGLVCGANASAIGLQQAYEAALQNDPTFRAAFYERQAGQEFKVLGRAGLLPNISASYTTNRNRVDLTRAGATGVPTTEYPVYTSKAANIQLRQPILNLDGVSRYRQGINQTKYSNEVYDSKGDEMALRLVAAYCDALLATEQLALAERERDTLAEQRRVNDRYFEKGEGTRTDMLETQARLDLAEAKVIEARDMEVGARNTLAGMIGMEVKSLDPLAPGFRIEPMESGGFERWRQLARERNPELLAQSYAIEISRLDIDRNRAGHAPRLDLVASYAKNDSETLNTFGQETTQRSVGIQLNIPLYAGGAVNAQTRQAAANYERAKADMDAKTDRVMLELRKHYDLVISTATRITALEKAVDSGKLLIQATSQSIKGGVRINLDLLNAQQQLYVAQRDLAQARYAYLVSSLRLRAGAGMMGHDDIKRVAAYFR